MEQPWALKDNRRKEFQQGRGRDLLGKHTYGKGAVRCGRRSVGRPQQ